MCVIVHLEPKKTLSKKILENCYSTNPHGWGIMQVRNGQIDTVRGMGDFNAFYAAWREADEEAERAIHFRIRTHGATNVDNCHPFKVTPDLYLMHNGVIQTHIVDNTMSDTYNFCRHELNPMVAPWPEAHKEPRFLEMVTDRTGGSRLLLMHRDGTILKIRPSQWSEREGCSFSNASSFYERTQSYGRNTHYNHGNYWDNDDYGTYNAERNKATKSDAAITVTPNDNHTAVTQTAFGLDWRKTDRSPNKYKNIKRDQPIKSDLYSGNKTDEEGKTFVEEAKAAANAEIKTAAELNEEIRLAVQLQEAADKDTDNLPEDDFAGQDDELEPSYSTTYISADKLIDMHRDDLMDVIEDYPEVIANTIDHILLQLVEHGAFEIAAPKAAVKTTIAGKA